MTLQEILKAKGLGDDVIEGIIADMKANKIYTTAHENMDVRYPKLKGEVDNLTARDAESTKLIEQLKVGTKDNEALQGKITNYEAQIADLVKQLNDQKIDAAMERKLAAAGAKPEDYGYLKYLWREKGEIALDDQGEIKGADDAVAGLKTQRPAQFEAGQKGKEITPQPLPGRNHENGQMTKAEFLRKPYAERAAFAAENPDAYNNLMNH